MTTMLSSLHHPHDLRGAEDKAYHMSRTVSAMASTQCILNCVQNIYSMASKSMGFSKRCTVPIVQNLYELMKCLLRALKFNYGIQNLVFSNMFYSRLFLCFRRSTAASGIAALFPLHRERSEMKARSDEPISIVGT